MAREPADPQRLAKDLKAGDRGALARAITLVESRRDADQPAAEALLKALWPDPRAPLDRARPLRLGISGVPGAGKSTLIEALGTTRADAGQKVAVLSIDPSSQISGGSLLGDKSRMTRLARHENAFVRPSPNATTLGGVAARTRETVLLCEAAGYDLIFVETVGVGQSETQVADLVDCSLVLLIAGAGDELQGLKRGRLVGSDLLVVNKADGDGIGPARACEAEFAAALRHLRSPRESWSPRIQTASSRSGAGLEQLWQSILEQQGCLLESGELLRLRQHQRQQWLDERTQEHLQLCFGRDTEVRRLRESLDPQIENGSLLPTQAARQLVEHFRRGPAAE